MIDKREALILASIELKKIELTSSGKLAFLLDATIEFEYGWVFFYQSEEFVRTGILTYLLGGNGPLIVDKYRSEVHTAGSSREVEFYIDRYCEYRDDLEKFYSDEFS